VPGSLHGLSVAAAVCEITSRASAERAAAATGLARAFSDLAELVAASEVDIVSVTVKVSHHLEIAKAALNAGKHVYCGWPLGQHGRQACSARMKFSAHAAR